MQSRLVEHARTELRILEKIENSSQQNEANTTVMKIVEALASSDLNIEHTKYAFHVADALLGFSILTSLTGEDSEWEKIEPHKSGKDYYQNKRMHSVIKVVNLKDGNEKYYDNAKAFTVDPFGIASATHFSDDNEISLPYFPQNERKISFCDYSGRESKEKYVLKDDIDSIIHKASMDSDILNNLEYSLDSLSLGQSEEHIFHNGDTDYLIVHGAFPERDLQIDLYVSKDIRQLIGIAIIDASNKDSLKIAYYCNEEFVPDADIQQEK